MSCVGTNSFLASCQAHQSTILLNSLRSTVFAKQSSLSTSFFSLNFQPAMSTCVSSKALSMSMPLTPQSTGELQVRNFALTLREVESPRLPTGESRLVPQPTCVCCIFKMDHHFLKTLLSLHSQPHIVIKDQSQAHSVPFQQIFYRRRAICTIQFSFNSRQGQYKTFLIQTRAFFPTLFLQLLVAVLT